MAEEFHTENNKMKYSKVISALILGIFLISFASAIRPYGEWEDGSQSMTIAEGESVEFEFDFFSMNPPMTISVKLYDSNYNLIHTFGDTTSSTNNFFDTHTITGIEAGVYLVIIFGSDTVDANTYTLSLTVNPITPPTPPPVNNAPVITSTPITGINEGANYSYQVIATDADGDALTYSFIENPSWLSISSTGSITGTTPNVNSNTRYSITVRVSDREDFDTQTYTLTVNNVIEEDDTTDEDDEDSSGTRRRTHRSIRTYSEDDAYYQHLYFSQFDTDLTIPKFEESKPKLSWFQKLINTLVAFFKWIFRLE